MSYDIGILLDRAGKFVHAIDVPSGTQIGQVELPVSRVLQEAQRRNDEARIVEAPSPGPLETRRFEIRQRIASKSRGVVHVFREV